MWVYKWNVSVIDYILQCIYLLNKCVWALSLSKRAPKLTKFRRYDICDVVACAVIKTELKSQPTYIRHVNSWTGRSSITHTRTRTRASKLAHTHTDENNLCCWGRRVVQSNTRRARATVAYMQRLEGFAKLGARAWLATSSVRLNKSIALNVFDLWKSLLSANWMQKRAYAHTHTFFT